MDNVTEGFRWLQALGVAPGEAKYTDLEQHEAFQKREDLRSAIARMYNSLGSEEVLKHWWCAMGLVCESDTRTNRAMCIYRPHQNQITLSHIYLDVSILTQKNFPLRDYNIYLDYFTTVLEEVERITEQVVLLKATKKKPARMIQELIAATVYPVQSRYIYRYLMLWYLEKHADVTEERYVHGCACMLMWLLWLLTCGA